MRKFVKTIVLPISALLLATPSAALEMVIGEEHLEPGIAVIFEGAIKDSVTPEGQHLAEAETDVHLEARVNWTLNLAKSVPPGTPSGGFVPYLTISADVTNERTGDCTTVELTPHINLIDNFHYARNMKLPGKRSDRYKVEFTITPPAGGELAFHRDWRETVGDNLTKPASFTYSNLDFSEIAEASRN